MKPGMWFRNFFYWIFSSTFFENGKALRIAVHLAIEYPYQQTADAFRNQVTAMNNYDCGDHLSGIRSKTLVVCGKEDLLYPVETAKRLVQSISNVEYSEIVNAAHSIHMEQPKVLVNNIVDFLSE
jgi:pimeloyl-ACP methyl ester carboxylesterase